MKRSRYNALIQPGRGNYGRQPQVNTGLFQLLSIYDYSDSQIGNHPLMVMEFGALSYIRQK